MRSSKEKETKSATETSRTFATLFADINFRWTSLVSIIFYFVEFNKRIFCLWSASFSFLQDVFENFTFQYLLTIILKLSLFWNRFSLQWKKELRQIPENNDSKFPFSEWNCRLCRVRTCSKTTSPGTPGSSSTTKPTPWRMVSKTSMTNTGEKDSKEKM